jgi:hypothetical protein
MTQTMSTEEITTTVRNLPALPQVMAKSMLFAQGYRPTQTERAAMVARAEFFEMMGMTRTVSIAVVDFDGVRIGSLEFTI